MPGFNQRVERTMTKFIFVAAALVAAAAYTTEASAARKVASRATQATATAKTDVDCVRAPNVGSYATAPYAMPPCMPGTMR